MASSIIPTKANSRFRLHPQIFVNASKAELGSNISNNARQRPKRKFGNARDELIRRGKQTYEQKRLNQWRQLEERSAPDLDYIQALDQKQSVLEVQALLLGKLAAKENNLKGLGKAFESSDMSFEKRVSEVEEALRALRY